MGRMTRLPTLLACVCLPLLPPLQVDGSSETVALFRKVYARSEAPRERYEAVLEMRGLDTLEAAQALLVALEDEDFSVRRSAIEALATYRKEEIARWLCDDVLLERKLSRKTLLRAGAAEALGGMGHAWAYDACTALLGEKDMTLRLAAVAALGNLKNPAACASLSALAADPDGTMALAALDSLVRIGSVEGAQAAVVGAFSHPDSRARLWAIEAVTNLRLKAGVGPLIRALEVEDGRLRGDAETALETLTFHHFGDDVEEWKKWWARSESTFIVPDKEKFLAALEAARSKGGTFAGRKSASTRQFLTIETKSENLLFVIDVSGSMDTPFGDPERLKMTGRTYSSLQRLAIVKDELIATINDLPETTTLNIVAFATDVRSWKRDPQRATILNKAGASDWVSKLQPLGLKQGGTSFGLATGMETLEPDNVGSTNTFLALMTALGEPVDDVRHPQTYVTEESRLPLDTIFFLTDGEPTVGKTVDMNEIRREVQRVNAYRGVQIHVIFVGEQGGEDLEKLARENRGVFVKLGA